MQEIRELVEQSASVTILTGAGISVDSGVPDYSTGAKIPTVLHKSLLTEYYFQTNPVGFWNAYHDVAAVQINATPNRFHYLLTTFQQRNNLNIITQNTDLLHTKAGSKNVLELYGSIATVLCEACGRLSEYTEIQDIPLPVCTTCNIVLRPTLSLFGEQLQDMREAITTICNSDVFIVAGSSLSASPINELPLIAKYHSRDITTIWIDKREPPYGYKFDHIVITPFSKFVDSFML